MDFSILTQIGIHAIPARAKFAWISAMRDPGEIAAIKTAAMNEKNPAG
mgnify:CR=1 FL=1